MNGRHQDGGDRVADHSGVPLLSVHAAVGAERDDAAARRRVRADRDGRGVDGGLFYYGYSPFSLVAGVAMDRIGPRRVIPIGAATVGVGALLFGSGNSEAASIGRLLQGAGGVFALVGAAYIATTNFPASRAATLIGATQMFGMAGGSAGQFLVGPVIASGVSVEHVLDRAWGSAAWRSACCCFCSFRSRNRSPGSRTDCKGTVRDMKTVFLNPQSILCGIIAGLIFIPTTIFDMVWGVRYLQDARGFDYGTAVMRSAMVPFGWIIGCPLLGFAVGSHRPAQAGDRRRRGCAVRVPGLDPLRAGRRVSALRSGADRRASRRARRCCRTR